MIDVVKLLECFDTMISVGHSIMVIEHNLQFIQNADWVIDLGPGSADEGGGVVAVGTPRQISQCGESVTGKYLKQAFVEAGI
jgi:excinuclease ABC subunit A